MDSASQLVISAIAVALASTSQINAQSREAFDVASVKPNTTRGGGTYPGLAPGGKRFTAINLPLTALIMLAYDATPRQISGVPGELDKVGYDIEASCDHPMTKEQASRMLQTLLADRFKLAVHREGRDQPIYALVIGKGGPKLHESPADDTGLPDRKRSGSGFVFKRTPMATLTLILSQQEGRTVVDKTGLNGRYDFTLEYALEPSGRGRSEGAEPAPSTDGLASVFTALQEQIGLKLDSQKGSVEFLVVDHAEKLSAN
jgi:uncharacterized protein (TIGR03435 family)